MNNNKNSESFDLLYKKAEKRFNQFPYNSKNISDTQCNYKLHKIYFLNSGKNKKIIKQAISGYQNSFELEPEIVKLELYKYESSYFTYAVMAKKLGLLKLSSYLNYQQSNKFFSEFYKQVKNHVTNLEV